MARRAVAPQSKIKFLHAKQLEREADLLLAEYAEIIEPITMPPIPVEEMVGTVLKLRHRFLDLNTLFPFADVHGAIWFKDEIIGIDSSLNPDSFPRRRGRYHFTLAHEIGHWRLHRQYYLSDPAERLLFDDGSAKPDVVCRESERREPVEIQADAFAANLLMPRGLVHAAWQTFRNGDDRAIESGEIYSACHAQTASSTTGLADEAMTEAWCRPLAELFEVSPMAMRIRLEGLDLIVRKRTPTLF